MRKKIFLGLFIFFSGVFPSVVGAQTSWGIDAGGDGWSFSIGSGDTGSDGFSLGDSYGLPDGSILGIVENILFWLLMIVGIVAAIGFILSGLLYLTAAGDQDQIGRAKKAMLASIIGVIVALSGFVVLQAAFYLLTGQTF
jgi:hypothetical protein